MLRFLTAGESHGPSLTVIVEGLPAGLAITVEQIADELARRRLGYGRGPRMRFERDELRLSGGVRHGRTLGSPVAIEILNSEWPKWEQEMSASPGTPSDKLTKPRPGHADLAGMQKYAFDDARDVLERASARETAARVAAGALAKALLATIGVDVLSHVVRIGTVSTPPNVRPAPGELEQVDQSEVRCFDLTSAEAMIREIKACAKEGDSLGGIVEVIAYGVPVGLGSYVHWDRKLDGLLAGALMSIQAVKAVEIGDGMAQASQRGSVAHDAIALDASFERGGGYVRRSDHAGGLEGGVSSGAAIIAKVAMKPLATLNRPVLGTVDVVTGESTVSFRERTDVTAVPALGVVAEAMTALVLANEALRKFGGDSVEEFNRNYASYIANLGSTSSSARGH
jgi:chorismate synthase